MSVFEKVIEQVRSVAGADFAFVLTRKGRLVTNAAPPNMPEVGRSRLVRAARPLVGRDEITEVTMPREELVPYGGAAPVDVYVAVAFEQAIVCVVMATWADKLRVLPAIRAGVAALSPLLRRGLPRPTRRTLIPGVPVSPSPYPADAPVERRSSVPEIRIGEATLGRETMVAIDVESAGRRSSTPEIRIGEAALGRETLAAIDLETRPKGPPPLPVTRHKSTSSPEQIRVEVVSLPDLEADLRSEGSRATQPWVEVPADAKRALDAAGLGRKMSPPQVSVRLEDAEPASAGAVDRAKSSPKIVDAPPASERRRTKRYGDG